MSIFGYFCGLFFFSLFISWLILKLVSSRLPELTDSILARKLPLPLHRLFHVSVYAATLFSMLSWGYISLSGFYGSTVDVKFFAISALGGLVVALLFLGLQMFLLACLLFSRWAAAAQRRPEGAQVVANTD